MHPDDGKAQEKMALQRLSRALGSGHRLAHHIDRLPIPRLLRWCWQNIR
jgi:hypothetical protein